ncbi:unnamed protein product, partial [Durusdinium trenchii]
MTNTVENEIQQEAMTWLGWWEMDYKFTLRGFIFWNFIFLLGGVLAGALLKERMITWWNKLKELHDEMQRKRRDMHRRALAELHARDYVRQTTQMLEMYRGHVSDDQVQPPQLEPLRVNRVQAAYDRFLIARSERRVRERHGPEHGQQQVDEDGDVHMRTEEEEQNTIYDWSPTQARMVNYRILENSSDASSGESYFQRTRDGSSYVREAAAQNRKKNLLTQFQTGLRIGGYLYTLIPAIEKIRVERIYEAGFFPEYLCKQFLQLLAAKHNPEEPGLQFDYALMYDIYDRNYHKMFRDLVNGEYDQTWDAIVEAWHNRDEDRDHLIFT